jgi:LacI family transcriptional regulator
MSMSPVRTTQKQLAELAGVTPAAVTAALSETPSSIRVSRQTRERIRRLALEHNYKPDIRAKGLVQRKSFLIGILCTEGMSHVMWEVVHGIEQEADRHDYSVLLSAYPDSLEQEATRLQRSLDRNVDAMAVIPVMDEQNRTNIRAFHGVQRRGVPLLQLFDRFLPGIPSIMEDGHAAGVVATRHLLDLGHRRILHLTMADYDDRLLTGRRRNTKARYEGYRDTMLEAGLEPIICDSISNRIAPPMYGEARRLAGWIMEHPAHPTAVFCYSDRIAFGLLNGLADLGVRVPQDMSVVGFDNLPAGVWSRPALTSVGIDRVEMGKRAAGALFSATGGEMPRAVQLKPRLVQRQSTDVPGVRG